MSCPFVQQFLLPSSREDEGLLPKIILRDGIPVFCESHNCELAFHHSRLTTLLAVDASLWCLH